MLNPCSVLNATADPNRTYPYRSDRLWFLSVDGAIFAVMARTSDDAMLLMRSGAIRLNAAYGAIHG